MAANDGWAEEVRIGIELARTIRDELKLQMHLASMEARQRFEAIERQLENDQLKLQRAIKEAIAGYRQLKDELGRVPR